MHKKTTYRDLQIAERHGWTGSGLTVPPSNALCVWCSRPFLGTQGSPVQLHCAIPSSRRPRRHLEFLSFDTNKQKSTTHKHHRCRRKNTTKQRQHRIRVSGRLPSPEQSSETMGLTEMIASAVAAAQELLARCFPAEQRERLLAFLLADRLMVSSIFPSYASTAREVALQMGWADQGAF